VISIGLEKDKIKVRVVDNTDFTRGREERRFLYLIWSIAMNMPEIFLVAYVVV